MEAIILAGGYGKRLKPKIVNIPKPMAPVNGKPFLDYIINFLSINNVNTAVLSLFYKHEIIQKHYSNNFNGVDILYSIDQGALGTGGAIRNGLFFIKNKYVFIINGDTYFNVDLRKLIKEHIKNNNEVTFSLKPMVDFNRYGFVKINDNGDVLSFREKEFCKNGLIDGGIYVINKDLFSKFNLNKSFSFNKFLIKNMNDIKIGSVIFDKKFIDIGTPSDFDKANELLAGLL